MNKLIFSILLVIGSMISLDSNAQSKVKYYYYPSENVYYNTTTKQYGYAGSNSEWSWGTLPTTVTVPENDRYVVLYGQNDDIWKQNETHKMKYKNGQLKKIKIKSND